MPKYKHIYQFILLLTAITLSGCSFNKPIVLYDKSQKNLDNYAILKLPVEIDVVFYEGEKRRFMPSYQPIIEYHIAAGEQTIGFRYEDIFTDFDGDEQVVKSKIVFINFLARENVVYTIDFKPPRDLQDAQRLTSNLQLKLFDGNQTIAKSFKRPGILSSGFSSLFEKKDNDKETANKLNTLTESDHLSQLKFWWEKASKEERKEFDIWRDDSPNIP